MTPSTNCYDLTKSSESCSLTAYQDPAGTWTIGYGHTGPEVVEGLVWTMAQAQATLVDDVSVAATAVNSMVHVPLTQGEFDALTDFVFNVGASDFYHSTLLEMLNNSDYTGASEQFPRWDESKGVVLEGLVTRRLAEQALFNQGKSR
jgi:lysozyme